VQTDVLYQDYTVPENSVVEIKSKDHYKGFIYNLYGSLSVVDRLLEDSQALILENIESISVKAHKDSRFIYLAGKPHDQPIRQVGPYVF